MNPVSPYPIPNLSSSGFQETAFTPEPPVKKSPVELPVGWNLPLALLVTLIVLLIMIGLGFVLTRLLGR